MVVAKCGSVVFRETVGNNLRDRYGHSKHHENTAVLHASNAIIAGLRAG